MRFLATLVVALALVSPKASAALSCEEFLTFPKTNQQLFVRGLVDGKATVFGVTDTAARLLKKAAKSADEKTGIDKMHDFPQNFMSKGCCISNEEITEKIIKGCTAKPDRPVGNMLTDVMSGAL